MKTGLGQVFDLVVLGHVLHYESVENARQLLRRVHDALPKGGRVAIAEFLVTRDRSGPTLHLLFALSLLLNSEHGNIYSDAEIVEWLEEIGYVDIRKMDAPAPSPLILATRA